MLFAVITTIQRPTNCVRVLAHHLQKHSGNLVVAGDSKGPADFALEDRELRSGKLVFLSLQDQFDSQYDLARLLPTKHYARKNVAYLHAISAGASCIYETDDDNGPLGSWTAREEYLSELVTAKSASTESPAWVNVYKHFSSENIWPRGLPLDRIHSEIVVAPAGISENGGSYRTWAPIQQGLADGSPDVDAIWRLVQDREFRFERRKSAVLPAGQWCPFNTQSTWWWPTVYPLLYIPSYCSFRMCDIWKSFIAQRCLWELGVGVVFHAPEVWQDRNFHDLMRDFNDEVPGYQLNHRIATILEAATLVGGRENVASNMKKCYLSLVSEGIFPEFELQLVDAWLKDLQNCGLESDVV